MTFPRRRFCAALLVAFSAILSIVVPAHGQPAGSTQRGPARKAAVPVRKTSEASGYEYRFSDDVLDANPSVTGSLIINVRGGATRVTLIRPRVQFVPEMLKSVEAL